jgi:hypothetical protein
MFPDVCFIIEYELFTQWLEQSTQTIFYDFGSLEEQPHFLASVEEQSTFQIFAKTEIAF